VRKTATSTSIPRKALWIGTLLTISWASPKGAGRHKSTATPAPDGGVAIPFGSKKELTATNGAHWSRLSRGLVGPCTPYRCIIATAADSHAFGLMRTPPRRQSWGLLPEISTTATPVITHTHFCSEKL